MNGARIEYRDLATIFSVFVASGSFIVSTLNTKFNVISNDSKLQFDRGKFDHDKKLTAFNLFREYNSEEMVGHLEIAVSFMRENKDMDDLELIVKLNKDIASSKSVTIILNNLELTAISYQENIGDRTLIKESPDFFNNFETVAREWNKLSEPTRISSYLYPRN